MQSTILKHQPNPSADEVQIQVNFRLLCKTTILISRYYRFSMTCIVMFTSLFIMHDNILMGLVGQFKLVEEEH